MSRVIRILHVTESHSASDGGVTTVVNELSKHLSKNMIYSCVAAGTSNEEFTPEGVDFFQLGKDVISLKSFFSRKLKNRLHYIIKEKDINIIHLHGFWLPQQVIAGRLAKELGIPCVLTCHGMLEPWLWKGKGVLGYLKKKIYFYCFAYNIYKHCNVIHSITLGEEKNLKKLFPNNRHYLISNSIELACTGEQSSTLNRTIFYIGRLNPKKGVILLLQAFKEIASLGDWKLCIAGPEEVKEYAQSLKSYVNKNNLDQQVSFVGPVYSEKKKEFYQNSWITVVPSFSEVVGLVNLEASSYYCPTITTYQTGLLDWEDGGGILVSPDVEEIISALKNVISWTVDERLARGNKSFQLVKSRYGWDQAADRWVQLYSRMIDGFK